MLRWKTCLGLFSVVIDVQTWLAVQSHASELHCGSVHCIVSWHYDRLLLFLYTTLEASGPAARSSKAVRARCVATHRWTSDWRLLGWQRSKVAWVDRASSAGNGLRCKRVRLAGEMLDILFSQWVLRRC